MKEISMDYLFIECLTCFKQEEQAKFAQEFVTIKFSYCGIE